MDSNDLARQILMRLRNSRWEAMSDADLKAITDAPLTESERATVRLYSAGRTDDFNQLTDNELERIANNWPPA